ncbi:helix-turn-helix domain-containing protein [Gillisia limnaea]|uniref:Helix-turn-helix, AraC domain-containing protein n=2 Tax=Gillisia TaxID=244698 RepID=H2BTL3_GILLR|nr:Helix-turn-helix, AraC domain-containing protein [Gillisia limnaea DSM 15749]
MIFSPIIQYFRFRALICLALVFCVTQMGFSQTINTKSPADYSITTSYEQLHIIEAEAAEASEFDKLRNIIRIHVSKSKKENNPIELARAFYHLIFIEESQLALAYADSIILITENSDHKSYPTLGYTLKANLFYDQGKFQPALDNFLKAYNLALEKENKEDQGEISLAIAAIRNINGQHYAAADLYKRSLNLLKQNENFPDAYYEDYSTLLYNLSLTYLRLSQIDTAKFYVRKGLKLAQSLKKTDDFRDFVLVDAQINYYQKDYKKSKDSLLKYINKLEGTERAIKLYYLGKIEKFLKNDKLAMAYFKEIDSIVSLSGDPFGEVKDVYQQLIIYSVLEDNEKEQIEYIEKLIHNDSILSSAQENVNNQVVIAYDIPDLKRQKLKAEKQLEAKTFYIIGIAVFAGIAILIGIYFFLRSRNIRKRLNILMEGGEVQIYETKQVTEHPSSVPIEIRKEILSKLNAFENSDRYLNKDLDLSNLANDLGTNTTYLSTIINHYKKVNFPNYLKDLRIRAAINRLSKDPDLLKYNHQGLAEIFGFKTGESFSKAFYKKTGVSPSMFLNELKSRETSRHL